MAAAGSIASSTCKVRRCSSSFKRLGPMLQRDQTVDVLVVALLVERGVDA